MSSMHRSISGQVLVQHLDHASGTIDAELLARHGRSARTLVKEGPLRLTLMALAPGGSLPPHSTDDPVSIHVVDGDVTFVAIDREYALERGDVLVFAPGVEHAARSTAGTVFLLTVVHEERLRTGASPSSTVHRHPIGVQAKDRWAISGARQHHSATTLDEHPS
jgi:quercetin dioxygenase-like cupin family protein